ncbi:PD40 domain-containing protein [Lysobacter silvisoli]|uniref:TolB-like protein n=1 Tax=Lysobacter silvisoli TaxID=2293254 RepID=A0A371JXR5_9GAMM|nr:PD40 domain-containing protein [Lysobacter silvisoli]RDZ26397.1 TolB-like protein [Lysobacter silvisoli]
MRRAAALAGLSLLSALLLAMPAAGYLSEFGIEGMGVVSTPGNEVRASVSPDGRRIVWGSTDRPGGAGGWDLWQAQLKDGRWQDATPLALNSAANDFDPAYSADGRWLYFFSNRPGGRGGDDLYRAPVRADGSVGAAENLGAGVNTRGDEWAPTPSTDGRRLLFASDGHGGAGRHDLFVAQWNGQAFADPQPVPGVNTGDDEFDAAWLGDGRALVFARSRNVEKEPIRLWLAQCEGKAYGAAVPLALSFNSEDGATLGPALDWNKPAELLVTGRAKAPKAGKLDIYRMKAPAATGQGGCVAAN